METALVHDEGSKVPPLDPGPTVQELVVGLRDGKTTSSDLVLHGRSRIAQLDEHLGAVITVCDQALADAQESDRRRSLGRPLSPLDGVPFTVKDSVETSGVRTTHGSPLFTEWVPNADAPLVAKLKETGMVMLAKVSLDDFAAATFGESTLRGPMRNPHGSELTVGGSSGGSAISVAVGYAPVSVGTDTGGSLRIPAALVGVAALRGAHGLLPTEGIFPRTPSQDTVGPVAADVLGLKLVMEVLGVVAGEDAGRSGSLRFGVVRSGLALLGDDPDGPVMRRFDQALAALEAAGVKTVPVVAPPSALLMSSSLIDVESAAAVDDFLGRRPHGPVKSFAELYASGAFSKHARRSFEREWQATLRDLSQMEQEARQSRTSLRHYTDEVFQRHRLDAVVYPSVQFTATEVGLEQPGVFTRWSEHTGRPALGIPLPREDGELPASLELMGHEDGTYELLEVGLAVEAALHAGGAQEDRRRRQSGVHRGRPTDPREEGPVASDRSVLLVGSGVLAPGPGDKV